MEQIVSNDNLNAAYLQVVRNKGAAGVDGMTVEELGAYLSEAKTSGNSCGQGSINRSQSDGWRYPNQVAEQETLEYQQ